jgi:hypothetical protein
MELLSTWSHPWVNLQHLVNKVCEWRLYLIRKIFQPHNEVLLPLCIFTDGPIIRERFSFHCEFVEDAPQTPNIDFIAEG